MIQWEKRVNSLDELREAWKDLEQDAGIRINAGSGNSEKNIFLFFYSGIYWINISEKKEVFFQFKDFNSAERKLMELVKGPFKAWVY